MKKYTGENLKQIKFLIGGIGTGSISIEGRGSLTDWEIFNRPGKGKVMFGNFVAIGILNEKKPLIKIIAREPFPPYDITSSGIPNIRMEGFPHFQEAEFINFFPFAILNFIDRNFPLKIELSAYNPFIPGDEENSSLPIGVFKYRIKNLSRKKIEFFLSFSMMNPVGTDGTEDLNSLNNKYFGKNVNEYKEIEGLKGLLFKSNKYPSESERYGNICLMTDSKNVSVKNQWESKGWWDWNGFVDFWDEFKKGGFKKVEEKESEDGKTFWASLGVREIIMPEEEVEVKFYLSWYFPNRINYWGLNEECKGKILKNWYATKFNSSIEVVEHFRKNEKYLEEESKKFAESFFSSDIPLPILNTVSCQFQILKSNTFFRTDDGYFYGFEGCRENSGCCPLNCTHVYNYEQTISFLFPNLAKKMREAEYLYNVDENGYMAFRVNLPLGIKIWQFKPAADGQPGNVLKAYREWKLSGDNEFLKKIYPYMKKTVEFIWRAWDCDKDGLMEGEQHNTYDIEFYGANPFTSFIYLASLKAMSEISEFLGDIEFSQTCKEIYEKGKKNIIEKLWNGKYFIQKCNKEPVPPYQFLNGCLCSQLLGQAISDVLNLGNIVEEKYINKTLDSILKFNFKNLSSHENYMRIYAIDNERGIVICTWPYNDRPEIPMPYSDEVFTGEEFTVAGLLIKRGRIKEAMRIIEAIEERHDGKKRNPFNHIECGYHYARALSSYILLLSFSGFWIDNVKGVLFFKPVIFKKNFRIFFSSGYSWGIFEYSLLPQREIFKIKIEHGFLKFKEIEVKYWKNRKTKQVKFKVDDREVENLEVEEKDGILRLKTEKVESKREIIIIRYF